MANGPIGATDVRINVYKPDMSALWQPLDIVEQMGDFSGGQIQYEDTPSGCGAATLELGLTYEQVVSRGYYAAFNIIEISTGDMLMTANASSGASKIYVNSNAGFDPQYSPDAGQSYFWDGLTLTMRVPVTGIGSDGGGPYITIGAPLGGGSIPAYTIGTLVGRRRYTGRIVRVSQPNQKQPKATITCVGLNKLFDQRLGTFTYTSIDVGTAIYLALEQFAAYWPQLTISVGNFAALGVLYTGTGKNVTVTSTINNALGAIVSGDLWAVRVGHDRTPRMVKLFTNSTGAYVYNVSLPQGVSEFEPVNVLSEGQDTSSFTNSVYVIGDQQPGTKQPWVANVQNTTSIGLYGQWDTVVTNLQCKSTAACLALGTSILNASDYATAQNSFRVYTRNDNPNPVNQPAGLNRGDVVCGVTNVTVSRFSGTGSVVNLVPDSEFDYYPEGVISAHDALWTDNSSGFLVQTLGGGPSSSNALEYTGTGSASGTLNGISSYIDVVANQVLTLSAYIDASHVTSGTPGFFAWNSTQSIGYASLLQTAGVASRISVTFTVPGGVTQIYIGPDNVNCVVTSGQKLIYSQPQLQVGNTATSYVPNYGAPPLSGLLSSAQTTISADKDSWQDCKYELVQPDISAAMALRTNAVSTALVSNAALGVGLDQYFVSPGAWPSNNYAGSTLNITPNPFQAVFALNSNPVWVATSQSTPITGIAIPTLTANATNWVWLMTPSGYNPVTWSATWQVTQNPNSPTASTLPYPTSILYGIFQTNATGVVGATSMATIGSLGMPMGYLYNGVYISPTFSTSPGSVPVNLNQGAYTSVISVTFTITNQPTNGSLSKVMLWYQQASSATPLFFGSLPPNNGTSPQSPMGPFSATGTYTFVIPELTNNIGWKFFVSMEAGASAETPQVLVGTYTTPPVVVAASTLPAYGTNLLNDSNFQYSSFGTPSANQANSSSYWNYVLIDGISFGVAHGPPVTAGDVSNYLFWTSGASGSNRYGWSNPVTVTPGITYVVQAYFDARNVTGSPLPFVAICNYTGLSEPSAPGSILQSITIPAGTNATIQVALTIPGGVTSVVVMLSSAGCTINNSTAGGFPGVLIGMDPMLQSSSTGLASPYVATVGANPDGSQANTALSIPVQTRIAGTTAGLRTGTSAVLRVDSGPGAVSGNLPQSNHDPTVVLGSVTGTQKNLVGDSGIIYGSGGDQLNYWANAVYWNIASHGGPSFPAIYFSPIGYSGNHGFIWFGTGSAMTECVDSAAFALIAGTYTLSCFIDAGIASSGLLQAQVWAYSSSVNGAASPEIGFISQSPGAAGRVSGQITVTTAGLYCLRLSMNNAVTITSIAGGFGSPQLESGSVATAYQQTGIPNIGGSAINTVLVAKNQPISPISIGTVSTYNWTNAFNLDISMHPNTQSFFVEISVQCNVGGYSGGVTAIFFQLSVSGGTATDVATTIGYQIPVVTNAIMSFNALGGSVYQFEITAISQGGTMNGSINADAIHTKGTRML